MEEEEVVAMKGGGTEISSFSWDSTGRSQSRAYHAFGSLPSAIENNRKS